MKRTNKQDIPDPANFRKALISWFKKNARALPWRGSRHWYPVFLSEFLLQQTQVDQAMPYYHKFIKRYPTLSQLAQAEEQEVLTLWAGLGYYARARNMLKSAYILHNEFNGRFPLELKQAIALPGIGPYTAAAILSIAFNIPIPVVDGNVIRVITRVSTISADTRQRETLKTIEQICSGLIDPVNPGIFNEAIMELGALICRPQNPDCRHCPLIDLCSANKKKNWQAYPVKSPPAKKKRRSELVFILREGKKLLLAQRPASGLLASLWEFPAVEIETDREIPGWISASFPKNIHIRQSGKYRHIYSHINLQYSAVFIEYPHELFRRKFNRNSNYLSFHSVDLQQLSEYPIHIAHKKLLKWLSEIESE